MPSAEEVIDRLGLLPHPEGGWFHETWRAEAPEGERARATLIHFLLTSEQRSHWHRVDAEEIWLWHAGNPLILALADSDGRGAGEVVMGPDVLGGQSVQHVIPAGHWQAARPLAGADDYSLVSCVVAPGFDFAGFTLAPPGWEPGV